MFNYLTEFLKDIRVASISPTAASNVNKVIDSMSFKAGQIIVEYGPGDGAFTRTLLTRMPTDSRLVVIESNRKFVDILRAEIHDLRLEVIHDDAARALDILHSRNISDVDYILSGIPFSMLEPDVRHRIIHHAALILKPSGRFIVYQSLMIPWMRTKLKEALDRTFKIVNMHTSFLNMPPLYFFEAMPNNRHKTSIH